MSKQEKYKIRFHLAKGENFMKWQIRKGNMVSFYDPEEVSIYIKKGKLFNRKTTARKIHEGANKEVCAWIESDRVFVIDKKEDVEHLDKVSYNPKVTPNWVMEGEDVDGQTIHTIVSKGRELYGLA